MASRTVQGKIARVSGKPFKDNRTGEDITLYSFQLEGSNEWFRTGKNPIPAGVGLDVKFVAQGANVEHGTIQVVQAQTVQAPSVSAAVPQPSQPSPTTTSGRRAQSTGSKDDYWANKEARDLEKEARFQAVNEPRMALSVATEAAALLVSTAITKDAISFGNASKAKKLGLLSSFTKEVALDLARFINDAPQQLANYKPSEAPTSDTQDAPEVQE